DNNFVDTDAALGMVADFSDPCVAIIKHTNPAGLAVDAVLERPPEKALAGDPVSAFGGIVAANGPIDRATARRTAEVFTEVVIAPGYHDDALDVLTQKANLRILEVDHVGAPEAVRTLRSVDGLMLVQDGDVGDEPFHDWQVVSDAQPDDATMAE